jgi:hypothetical protein
MALLMEKGSEPLTENEKADLEAIAAIKESSALELKVCMHNLQITIFSFFLLLISLSIIFFRKRVINMSRWVRTITLMPLIATQEQLIRKL